ncbi:class II aldolase/adducin family protein [Paenibacillus sp. PL2-23]|uniref:class II aldolase/adducin family protein n=1 Tax=Paenibacillus sp. PL2-23 TaxID=2100729 RepID=UPI0030F5B468
MKKFDSIRNSELKKLESIQSTIKELAQRLYDWNYIDTTGGSFSVRFRDGENTFALTPTHSGFRRWSLNEGLVVLDENCNRDPLSTSSQPGHPSAMVHAEIYKRFPFANAVIHTHSPYSLTFAANKQTIKPYTLQSQVLGEVPCVEGNDDFTPTKHRDFVGETEYSFTDGMAGFKHTFRGFSALKENMIEFLEPRAAELESHGLAFTNHKHGIFVIARTLDEAFDNLIRIERNAQVQLLSRLLPAT